MMIACAKHKGFIEDCGCPDPLDFRCLGVPQITARIGTDERKAQQEARNKAFIMLLDSMVQRSSVNSQTPVKPDIKPFSGGAA